MCVLILDPVLAIVLAPSSQAITCSSSLKSSEPQSFHMVLRECGCLIVTSEHRELCFALEKKQHDLLNWIMELVVLY